MTAWQGLSLKKRIAAGGSVIAVIAILALMTSMTGTTNDALLMGGLSPAAAGEVAAELDAQGIPYTAKGSNLYVPADQRDRLRLVLAQQGLPRDGGEGYELLDELSGFSTTADMFDAAYWRAKEGELARTIRAIPGVTATRVHLGVGRGSAFARRGTQKTASVTVETAMGLSPEQARSVQMLVALAVSGLSADQVAVIDNARGLLAGPGLDAGPAGSGEADRAAAIETRLTRLLEARVGQGHARVSVAVELDRAAMTQTERLVAPDRQVARRLVTEERSREEGVGGTVTVASNLPTGDTEEFDDPLMRNSVTREDISYVGTETERTTQIAPGAMRRLSVAVLLDEPIVSDANGNAAPAPRSQEELDALRALVVNAAGIDEARGDTLALRSMPFTEPEPMTEDGMPGFVEEQIAPHAMRLIQLGLLAIVALVLGLFVVKPLLTNRQNEAEEDEAGILPMDAAGLLTVLVEESPEDAAAVLDAWLGQDAAPQRRAA